MPPKKGSTAAPKKKQRRTRAPRSQQPPQLEEEQLEEREEEREEDHENPLPPPDLQQIEEEHAAEHADTADTTDTVNEANPDQLETEEPGGEGPRKRVGPRTVTNFTEEEKDLIIDFLQQNPVLYSKRLTGYKDTAAKDRLWAEQASQMNRTASELKTWYESMRTKLGKLKKAAKKSGQAAGSFTATEL